MSQPSHDSIKFVWRLNQHNIFDNIEKLEMIMIFKPKMKIFPSFVLTTALLSTPSMVQSPN